ncbi:hypothetical protein LJC56_06200 [Christensenellaceae bacterium OttesenSCG-928-K19]|nr:hypothetical protein [Christensenellaceae bacterium OttesenSCG-928-K19]
MDGESKFSKSDFDFSAESDLKERLFKNAHMAFSVKSAGRVSLSDDSLGFVQAAGVAGEKKHREKEKQQSDS